MPTLVGRDRLLSANSSIQAAQSGAELAGPGLVGLLVRALGAPAAVAVDAATYAWSVMTLAAIAHPMLWRHDVDVDSGQLRWFMWDLGTVQGAVFQPSGLSPNGTTLAGSVAADNPHASVWRDGSWYLLQTGFYAEDVNDAGLVVGVDSKGKPVTWTIS